MSEEKKAEQNAREEFEASFKAWTGQSISFDKVTDDEGDERYADEWLQGAWIGWQARAASTSVNVARGAEELGWAWERRYLNGGYSRKFCVSEFDARELAKDGENLPAHDLVYPFYAAPPAQTALTDERISEIIDEFDGCSWIDGEFRIDCKEVMRLARTLLTAAQSGEPK